MALAGCLFASPLSFAMDPMQGSLVPATPYDSRLAQIGRLPDPSAPMPQIHSAESLFAQAKAFRYRKDAGNRDYWQTPQETESRWTGDCEDKAVWLFAQLKNNGYADARLVIGRENASSGRLHVWVVLLDNASGGLLILDPTSQNRIWRSADFPDGAYQALYSFDGTRRWRHDA